MPAMVEMRQSLKHFTRLRHNATDLLHY